MVESDKNVEMKESTDDLKGGDQEMKSSDAGASTAATDKGESGSTFASLAAESTDKNM